MAGSGNGAASSSFGAKGSLDDCPNPVTDREIGELFDVAAPPAKRARVADQTADCLDSAAYAALGRRTEWQEVSAAKAHAEIFADAESMASRAAAYLSSPDAEANRAWSRASCRAWRLGV